jgi:ferredoxin
VTSFFVAPLAVAACAAGWLVVQRAWMRSFPGASPDPDALSGRLGCHGCGECERNCERQSGEPATAEEDPS